MFRHLALPIVSFAVLAGLSSHVVAHAGGPQFTTIDIPNAVCGTFATGIDSRGDIAGTTSNCNSLEGFLLSHGRYTLIDFPNAFSTEITGVNPQGNIVGVYADFGLSEHGFLLRDGRYTTIVGPNGLDTLPAGINAEGDIVGTYFDPQTLT